MNKEKLKTKYVLMVCVDNICRSPIAEAVLRDLIMKASLQKMLHVDSAAIEAWHMGDQPDERALSVLKQHKIDYHSCARRILPEDFQNFDYILGMDTSIMASLKMMMPHDAKAKLLSLSDFLIGLRRNDGAIEDPYYEIGEAPFQKIFEQCTFACENFLNQARNGEV